MDAHGKYPLTYEKQVTLLKERGLSIPSHEEAVRFFSTVSYYRFIAYCIPFQRPGNTFINNTSFEQIVQLYRLDEALRNACMAQLSAIEIFMRTRIVYELSHGWGAFAHCDQNLFRSSFDLAVWTKTLEDETKRARETFIEQYKLNHSGYPRLPLWMACEVMSLGQLSRLYGGLLPDPQRKIGNVFSVHHSVLRNWLHFITYLRNICAHHGRLWNREFAIRPDIPHKAQDWQRIGLDNQRFFAAAVVLDSVCREAGLSLKKSQTLYEVMDKICGMDHRFYSMMGVPAGREIGMHWEML